VAKATQIPLCPGCRVSFDFVQVAKEAEYQKEWHRNFTDPGNCGRGFLELVGLNGKPLKPMSMKGGVVRATLQLSTTLRLLQGGSKVY